MGDGKFIYSTKDTPVYHNPGEAPFKTVNANDTIGKVESVNAKGNWLKLRTDQYNPSGGYVLTGDSMYTAILTTEAPKDTIDAVGREAEKVVKAVAETVSNVIPTWLKIAVIVILVVVLIAVFFRIKGNAPITV